MNKLSLITILLFFLILSRAEAISLGTVVKKDFITIKPNESAIFEILFWNVEENPYDVQIEVEKIPENWFVLVQPEKFSLNSSTGEEYINLPYLEKPIKASLVKIFIKPENARPDEYEIVIKAKAGVPSKGIAFFQERWFKLKVKIESETQGMEEKAPIIQKPFPITGKMVEQASLFIYQILAIICILVVSALIYKYA